MLIYEYCNSILYTFCIFNIKPVPKIQYVFIFLKASLQREIQRSRQETREAHAAREQFQEEMADLAETVEMATLDKEMAEEKAETLQIELEQLKEKLEEQTLDLEILRTEMSERV